MPEASGFECQDCGYSTKIYTLPHIIVLDDPCPECGGKMVRVGS